MTSGRDDRKRTDLTAKATSDDVSAFLNKIAQTPTVKPAGGKGRLIFAMDATASREPTWDRACHIQAEMFTETEALGGLEVQLVYYRGFGECKSSPWVDSPPELVKRMVAVRCLGGQTQLGRVLKHAFKETEKKKVNALVFVGDCLEDGHGLHRAVGAIDRCGHGAGVAGEARVVLVVGRAGQAKEVQADAPISAGVPAHRLDETATDVH